MVAARRVLIVEDERVVQFHLRVILEELGYEVSGCATTAAEAIESARERPPHLVLMDIGLEGGRDGIEAALELRSEHDLAIVFLSAFADASTIDRAQRVGAAGYVTKPFGKSQLRAALSTAMAGHEALRRGRPGASAPERSVARPRVTRPFGDGSRLAIYSHDTFGLGHLQRSLKLSRALTTRFPGLSILLLTGSPVADRFSFPAGVDYVKLPAVRKVASEAYEARSLGLPAPGMVRLRSGLIVRAIEEFAPHALLVDHSPQGMGGELNEVLGWLRRERPETRTVLGMRDVIDDPASVRRAWSASGIHRTLEESYDHVLVYGSRDVFDVTRDYGFSPSLAAKTTFCNYVVDGDVEPARERREGQRPLVVLTTGGGDGGTDALIGTYLDMLEERREDVDFDTLVLPGPLAPRELIERIERSGVEVHPFVDSTSPYFASADLVIATGGYNTMTQLLAHGRRAIVVPRKLHRSEQWIRAERMAELGLVTLLDPVTVDPARMFAAVCTELASRIEPLADARAAGLVPLDGARRVVEFFASLQVVADDDGAVPRADDGAVLRAARPATDV